MSGQIVSQDHTVVESADDYPDVITNDPAIVRLPDGRLLCSYYIKPRWATWAMDEDEREQVRRDFTIYVEIKRSDDGGESWETLGTLERVNSFHPFVVDGELYALAHRSMDTDIILLKSTDGGKTWSDPTTLFEGMFWNAPTPTVRIDTTLYKAYGRGEPGASTDYGSVVIAGDLTRDLQTPSAWRMSNPVYRPSPAWALQPDPDSTSRGRWLEGNVVNVRGTLRVYLRPGTGSDVSDMTSIAGICEVSDDGSALQSSFRQFHSVPGADCKFTIRYDERSDLFWMAANLSVDPQDTLGVADRVEQLENVDAWGDRRFLMLYYSVDCLNWFHAGCVARATTTWEAFMYPYFVTAGDDLLLVAQTCSENATNFHDSDQVTFHRVPEFRSLAMDIHPTPLEVAASATRGSPGPREEL